MWKVPAIWEGGTCFILGGGLSSPRVFGVPEALISRVCNREERPAVYSGYYKPIHDRHVIGINNAYQLGAWIDILFFGDWTWFESHMKQLRSCKGLLVSCSGRLPEHQQSRDAARVKYVKKAEDIKTGGKKKVGLTSAKRQVVWNYNSGAAAINLAVHFGAVKSVLVGFDMQPGRVGGKDGDVTHWHGAHFEKHKGDVSKIRPPFHRHLSCFPAIKKDADAMGVTIYNMSPDSAIDCFPKITLEEALKL